MDPSHIVTAANGSIKVHPIVLTKLVNPNYDFTRFSIDAVTLFFKYLYDNTNHIDKDSIITLNEFVEMITDIPTIDVFTPDVRKSIDNARYAICIDTFVSHTKSYRAITEAYPEMAIEGISIITRVTHLRDLLIQAINDNDIDKVKILIKRVYTGFDDNKPLITAVNNGYYEIVSILVNDDCVDPAARDNYCIRTAAANGHCIIMDILLSTGKVDVNVNFTYPLRIAADRGHYMIVYLLLAQPGINVNALNGYALKTAIVNRHHDIARILISSALVKNDEDIIRSILSIIDNRSIIQLLLRQYPHDKAYRIACEYGNIHLINHLVAAGYDVNADGGVGLSISLAREKYDVARTILSDVRIDVSLNDFCALDSALHVTQPNFDIIRAIISRCDASKVLNFLIRSRLVFFDNNKHFYKKLGKIIVELLSICEPTKDILIEDLLEFVVKRCDYKTFYAVFQRQHPILLSSVLKLTRIAAQYGELNMIDHIVSFYNLQHLGNIVVETAVQYKRYDIANKYIAYASDNIFNVLMEHINVELSTADLFIELLLKHFDTIPQEFVEFLGEHVWSRKLMAILLGDTRLDPMIFVNTIIQNKKYDIFKMISAHPRVDALHLFPLVARSKDGKLYKIIFDNVDDGNEIIKCLMKSK